MGVTVCPHCKQPSDALSMSTAITLTLLITLGKPTSFTFISNSALPTLTSSISVMLLLCFAVASYLSLLYTLSRIFSSNSSYLLAGIQPAFPIESVLLSSVTTTLWGSFPAILCGLATFRTFTFKYIPLNHSNLLKKKCYLPV